MLLVTLVDLSRFLGRPKVDDVTWRALVTAFPLASNSVRRAVGGLTRAKIIMESDEADLNA